MNQEPDLGGLRLLLVEDQYALAVTLADVAVALGADVVGPVAEVSDALALIERLPELDGAVLDVHLGDQTTYAVADALMARGLPFLFATGAEPLQLPRRFADVPVCRKPFGVASFRAALERLAVAA
jgi:CheY-like chemotaxis protein